MKRFLGIPKNSLNSPGTNSDLIPSVKKRISLRQAIVAGTCAILGGTALVIGIRSIGYHLIHLIFEDGLVNSRVVRLGAPIDGKVTAFYFKPGMAVTTGDILAKVERSEQEQQSIEKLKAEIKSKETQLQSILQTKASQLNRLESLEIQHESLWQEDQRILSNKVAKSQAALKSAKREAEALGHEYQNYENLYAQGAISKNKLDQTYSRWQGAKAKVEKARASLKASQVALRTSQSNLAIVEYGDWAKNVIQEIQDLRKEVQTQSILADTLSAEIENAKKRLEREKSQYRELQKPVPAPFAGVIYKIHRERDEQVKQSEPIMTLLDCQQMWVEIIVSADRANSIDITEPAIVELVDTNEKLTGKVELIKPIDRNQQQRDESGVPSVKALSPIIPEGLEGEPLNRVTVLIPPSSSRNQPHNFCGVGQTARVSFGKKLFGN